MLVGRILRQFANESERNQRQDLLLDYIKKEKCSQRKLYLKIKDYTLSYKTFTRDIKEMEQRGLIKCQVTQKKGKQTQIIMR